jgi:hypothetical protein
LTDVSLWVRFTDEAHFELVHVTIGLVNDAAIAAVAFVSFEADLANVRREIAKQESELANESYELQRD